MLENPRSGLLAAICGIALGMLSVAHAQDDSFSADDRYGEELCAWIIPQDGEAPTEAEIIEYCRGRIAHYKIPRYVRFVQSFPMTVTGKIQKYLIRDAMKNELGIEEAKTA